MGNYCKFEREVYQVSYDNGTIYYDVIPEQTRKGELIERNSTDCGYEIEPIYRWYRAPATDYLCDGCPEYQERWVNSGATDCDGYDKYVIQVRQISFDSGTTWSEPKNVRKAILETDSPDCHCTIMERWVDSGTTCVGYDKYNLQVKQISTNSGQTWTTTTETRVGSLIEYDSVSCGYVPNYHLQYLTFKAIYTGTFSFSGRSSSSYVQYSLDSGSTWNTLYSGNATLTVDAGQKIMWKGSLTPSIGIGKFSATIDFNVEGNIMSLLYGDNFSGETSFGEYRNVFYGLFMNCSSLLSAEHLILPATTLTYYCYGQMFDGCTRLTTAPELPATTLAEGCYYYMFKGCTSLTTAPYLPATTLENWCYSNMFNRCTSLTTAPYLPADILVDYCYHQMFQNCTNLNYVSCNATDLSATLCTYYWLDNVSSSGTFVKKSSASIGRGDSGIPSGWLIMNVN